MEFTRVALLKLNTLLEREKFVRIHFVDGEVIRITYEDRMCAISNFGKVLWYTD